MNNIEIEYTRSNDMVGIWLNDEEGILMDRKDLRSLLNSSKDTIIEQNKFQKIYIKNLANGIIEIGQTEDMKQKINNEWKPVTTNVKIEINKNELIGLLPYKM